MPAHDIEQAVIAAATQALNNRALLIERIGLDEASADQIRALLDRAGRIATMLAKGSAAERAAAVRDLIERVVIEADALKLMLRRTALMKDAGKSIDEPIHLTLPLQFRRRGIEMKLVIPGETNKPSRLDPALIKAVARGHLWFEDLASGRAAALQAIADREGVTEGYVRRLIPLAFLAPDIVEAILRGEQPVDLTAARLTGGIELPCDWQHQRRLLGH